MDAPSVRRPVLWIQRAGIVLASLVLVQPAVRALPFDPLPSAFQQWLNAKRDWPDKEKLRFENLAECSDQTAATSPYRMAVFTCLAGRLTIEQPGATPQRCVIERVSYFPANQRVRLWTGRCR